MSTPTQPVSRVVFGPVGMSGAPPWGRVKSRAHGAPCCHVRNQHPSAHLNSATRAPRRAGWTFPVSDSDARRPQPRPALPGTVSLTEGDLIIGLNRSAIGTVVESNSRYTLLVHLPRLEGYGASPPVKNGPALGGYGAVAMKDALTASMTTMPTELLRSLTWDRGKELSAHAQFKIDTGIAVGEFRRSSQRRLVRGLTVGVEGPVRA